MSDNKRTADLIQQATFADIYDKCTGYLELVRDGHLSLDDAWDAILDKTAHLDDNAACEISRLCFEWKQQHDELNK
jgi:hypothetical protein